MSEDGRNAKHIQNTSVFALIICLISFVLKLVSAFMGKTALQYVDSARSLVETTVVATWWYLCSVRKKELDALQKMKFNRYVEGAMIFLAIMMVSFSILKFRMGAEETGSLYLGFAVSAIGAINNYIVCHRYAREAGNDSVVKKQAVLFGIKSASDASVAITLCITIIFPAQPFAVWCRLIASLVVSVALVLGGILRDE